MRALEVKGGKEGYQKLEEGENDQNSTQITQLQKQVAALQRQQDDIQAKLLKDERSTKRGSVVASATAMDSIMGDSNGDGVMNFLGDMDDDGVLGPAERVMRTLLLHSGFHGDDEDKALFPDDHKKGYFKLVSAVGEMDDDGEHVKLKDSTTKVELKADTWGAFIYILVNDMPDVLSDIKKGPKAVFVNNFERTCRVSLTLLLFLTNLLCQGMMVAYVLVKIVLPAWKGTQELYGQFHDKMFTLDGGQWTFDNTGWRDNMSEQEKTKLCGMAIAMGFFLRVILFMWVSTNLQEVNTSTLQQRAIWSLPEVDAPQLMVADMKEEGHLNQFLICITKPARWSLMICVFYVKFFIAMVLTLAGCLWLMSATSVGDLILNSLSLGFVVQIDELLAITFIPHFFYSKLEAFDVILQESDDPYQPLRTLGKMSSLCGRKIAIYKERGEGAIEKYVWDGEEEEPEEEKARKQSLKHIFGYSESTLWFFLAFAFVEVLIKFQPVIPGYQFDVAEHCMRFDATQTPDCYPLWMHLLAWPFRQSSPLPWDQDCFPYGSDTP